MIYAGTVTLLPSGDTTGAIDTAAIQARLTAGGKVALTAGVFWINQTLQFPSGTWLQGAGMGATTIRAKAGFAAAQVGANTGMVMICTTGNAAANHITISDLTLDGNQATITSIPGYADGPECAPIGIWNSSLVSIRGVEVINAVGYSIYLQLCTDSDVTGCRVLSGVSSALGTNQQDGVHLTGCTHCRVENCSIDTGTGTAGDDGVAVQSLGTDCTDITITGNMIRAAQSGVHLAIGGAANIKDVAITGNTVWQVTSGSPVTINTTSTGAVTEVTVTGNTFRTIAGHAFDLEAPFTGVTITGNEFDNATNSLATGVYVGTAGSGLVISGNTFTNYGVASGIVIGPVAGGTAITKFTVTGNVLDMSGGTSAANGILVTDSSDGVISSNTVLGSTQAASAGIKVNGVSVAPVAIAVNGNRVKGWATGILETNGGIAPNFNAVVGNNAHGCTAFVTTVGTNDVVASNVVA